VEDTRLISLELSLVAEVVHTCKLGAPKITLDVEFYVFLRNCI